MIYTRIKNVDKDSGAYVDIFFYSDVNYTYMYLFHSRVKKSIWVGFTLKSK